MKFLYLFVITVALAASCKVMPPNTAATSRQIVCGPGPEDMELDSSAGKPRMIISCSQRREGKKGDTTQYKQFGEIMEYYFDGKPATVMPRVGGPTGKMFNPHGISIATVNGKRLLYAVNHSKISAKVKENHIEVYELQGSTLTHIRTISGPELISPNDCFATSLGDVYFTNDSGKGNYLWEKLWKLKKSTVYKVNSVTTYLEADHLAYANGIYRDCCDTVTFNTKTDTAESYKMGTLYVSTVQQKGLFAYRKGNALYNYPHAGILAEATKNIMPVNGQDNIMRCGDNLVVACHPKPIKFLKHAINPAKHSPTHVWAYNIKTGKYQMVFADDGSRVSTGSTAILYKGKLYVSQVFQPYILEVDLTVQP